MNGLIGTSCTFYYKKNISAQYNHKSGKLLKRENYIFEIFLGKQIAKTNFQADLFLVKYRRFRKE